jgi:hypothetical protein
MAFNFSKSVMSAASAGLMLGALSACGGGNAPAEGPSAAAPGNEAPAEPAAEAKACCKAQNECKGKGGCHTDANECAGKNECKGKGGCNGHCPK